LKPIHKNILWLILIEFLILAGGLILLSGYDPGFDFAGIAVLSLSFAFLSLLTLIIIFRGQKKDPEARTMYMLVAFGIKFILELVIALLWFFVAKKTGVTSVILFFVLYLAFTLFSVLVVLKTLKYKPL
jgi:hypothetical protein